MVDARLRGAWLGRPRFDDLSDAAWRVFTGALMWSNEQGTDGVVGRRYVRSLHPDGPQPAALGELVEAGLASITDDGELHLIGWAEELGQSTAARVTEYRESARIRQQRSRERRRSNDVGDDSPSSAEPVTDEFASRESRRDTHPNVTGDVGKGKGKGKGKGPTEDPLEVNAQARATRIPEPFVVTAAMRAWAAASAPGVAVDAVTATFVDYWRGKPGRDGTKADWPATWRNWLRREATPRASAPRASTGREQNAEYLRRVIAEEAANERGLSA